MNQSKRIFGIGTVVVDHVVVLPEYPQRDTKIAVQTHWRQVGGPVPVALSTAAFYGANVSFAGRCGEDEAGQQIHEVLSGRGVDMTPTDSDASWSTGFAHVWTEANDGTRTVACSRGEFPLPKVGELNRHRTLLESCQLLHLDGWAPEVALWAAKIVQQCGGRVILDAGSKKPGMESLLPLVDVLIASDLFCRSWFGESDITLQQVRDLGCRAVVRTAGAEGARYLDDETELHVSAIPIIPIETNGAGDVFSGAFLFGLYEGWAAQRTLTFANAVAGHSCARYGNAGWPSMATVEQLIA